MNASRSLSIIARIHPEAWDVIVKRIRVGSRFDEVALNPQPLPPAESFLVSAAEMAHQIARIAVETEVTGGSSSGFVSEFIDDWCGTPWPRKFPVPWPGPRRNEGPEPDPWLVATARMVGAVVFANIGSRLADGDLARSLLDGAERLNEAAIQLDSA
jgi:hypothetical protein